MGNDQIGFAGKDKELNHTENYHDVGVGKDLEVLGGNIDKEFVQNENEHVYNQWELQQGHGLRADTYAVHEGIGECYKDIDMEKPHKDLDLEGIHGDKGKDVGVGYYPFLTKYSYIKLDCIKLSKNQGNFVLHTYNQKKKKREPNSVMFLSFKLPTKNSIEIL